MPPTSQTGVHKSHLVNEQRAPLGDWAYQVWQEPFLQQTPQQLSNKALSGTIALKLPCSLLNTQQDYTHTFHLNILRIKKQSYKPQEINPKSKQNPQLRPQNAHVYMCYSVPDNLIPTISIWKERERGLEIHRNVPYKCFLHYIFVNTLKT